MGNRLSSCRGCLLGLAVGDAMGYTVDAKNWQEIREDYGPNGLLGYDLANGSAEVSSIPNCSAEVSSVRKLSIIDSTILTEPRIMGRSSILCFLRTETKVSFAMDISPVSRRTPTA